MKDPAHALATALECSRDADSEFLRGRGEHDLADLASPAPRSGERDALRLKMVGVTPVWSINHGPTTSLYYEDPDGMRLEFQTENFPTAKETAVYFHSSAFAENPIGVDFDPRLFTGSRRGGLPPIRA